MLIISTMLGKSKSYSLRDSFFSLSFFMCCVFLCRGFCIDMCAFLFVLLSPRPPPISPPGHGSAVCREGVQLARQGEASPARPRDRDPSKILGKRVRSRAAHTIFYLHLAQVNTPYQHQASDSGLHEIFGICLSTGKHGVALMIFRGGSSKAGSFVVRHQSSREEK